MVFYTWGDNVLSSKYDPGFEQHIQWDIPLMEGYPFKFVGNISKQPGSHHFKGIDNPTLIKQVKDWAPDAILIFGWNFKSHLKAIRYFHNKIPVVFRGDSTLLDEESHLKKMIKKPILKWVYSHVNTALYVGKENKKYFRYAGLSDSQLVFAPHAIDNNRFQFDAGGSSKFRASLGIPSDAFVFLFAGKLEPKKNPALLIEAFAQLNDQRAHLVIAGSGEFEQHLKSVAQTDSKIHFIPFQNQSQMPALYSACDVFVLPSRGPGETWGLSVNEAMACGRAVLVSNKCGCAADLVINGENGFVFESENEKDLTEKMKYFLKNRDKIQQMKTASRINIHAWNFERVCESIEETLTNNK